MALQVLVMEREPLVRAATEQMLTLCGAETLTFEDAQSASDALAMFAFDVVIAGVAAGDDSVPGFVSAAKGYQSSLGIVVGDAYYAHTRHSRVVDAYIGFPCSLPALRLALQQAVDAARRAALKAGPDSVFR